MCIFLKNINKIDSMALFDYVQTGNITKVKELIEHGADVNTIDNAGYTPLHVASYQGHTGIVKYLVKHGANVTAKNNMKETPLDVSVKRGHLEISFILHQKRLSNIIL